MASTVTSRRKQLGNELRHARNAAGMTQQQVAELYGVTVEVIERTISRPDYPRIS